ncbi:MAG: hypothetical protein K2K19_10885 [Acetatifactor sp.]|nr:hypothetical protein [Acetatifactor sp.]
MLPDDYSQGQDVVFLALFFCLFFDISFQFPITPQQNITKSGQLCQHWLVDGGCAISYNASQIPRCKQRVFDPRGIRQMFMLGSLLAGIKKVGKIDIVGKIGENTNGGSTAYL